MLTVSLTLPLPDALQVEPLLAAQVQVAEPGSAGNVSATVAPVALLGPALVTTMV